MSRSPRLASFIPTHVGLERFKKFSRKVSEQLEFEGDDINDSNMPHFYQFISKHGYDSSPNTDDGELIRKYADGFRDYINTEQIELRE